MKNELLDEVREARAALAAEHGYDSQRIYEWACKAHEARKLEKLARSGTGAAPTHSGEAVVPETAAITS